MKKIITLDFETYYDKKCSLHKLTTEEYIRDDRFEVIGVAVKVSDGESRWCSGTYEEIKKFLDSYHMDRHRVLAHNTMFDGAILSWIYDIHPAMLLDTLNMSRALDHHGGHSLAVLSEKYEVGQKGTEVLNAIDKHRLDFSKEELDRYGEYCKNDVDLTKKVFDILGKDFPDSELKLIDTTLKMFTEPVLGLNPILLNAHLEDTKQRKEKLLADSGYEKETLTSDLKFAEALRGLNVEPPTKISPKTKKETYAFAKTDEEFKQLLGHPCPKVRNLIELRLEFKSTLEETRTQRLIGIAKRGSLPNPLKYCGAHTTRWSGADKINLQNLPSRGKTKLKESITAPSGYFFVESDSSQIEARVLAWFAGQDDLTEAFRNKEDVYKIMASRIYSKPIKDISKGERFVGKTVILACGYGMGHDKFKEYIQVQGVDISESESRGIIHTYRTSNSKIKQLWGQFEKVLEYILRKKTYPTNLKGGVEVLEDGFKLPSGLPIRYPNLREEKDKVGRIQKVYDTPKSLKKIYGAKAVENVIQGLARCVIGEQILKIEERYRVVLTTHDSVLVLVKKEEVEEGRSYVEECMRWTPDWAKGLPLDCESGVGETYGDCK